MTNIKLDFDGPEPDFERIFNSIRLQGLSTVAMRLSRSRNGGWHVLIVINENLWDAEIVALQSICGSDWKREGFNLLRARRIRELPEDEKEFWKDRWNVLFEAD